ncbi:MAG TPA: YSC84-related protein [Casimicrobiaceae bacterium]|nr:YSC84-related protein [Casimicrobiaceae bacterium]
MGWLQRHIGEAKGVLVAPNVVRAGFIFGGAGGRAVLYTRDVSTGRWVGPAFYNVVLGSVGFQAGVSVSQNVTLVMTRKGIDSLLSPSFKLGVEASVAAGPVGAGAATNLMTDFVAFSRSKGIYGGVNLEGGVVSIADNLNGAYYGQPVTPTDILIARNVHGPRNDRLAAELDRATASAPSASAPAASAPAASAPTASAQGGSAPTTYSYNPSAVPPPTPTAAAETSSPEPSAAESSATGTSANSRTIRSAQQALNDKGFNAGAVDGAWGPHTQAAVRRFQKSEGLRQTARLDQATLQALGVSPSVAQAQTAQENNRNTPH